MRKPYNTFTERTFLRYNFFLKVEVNAIATNHAEPVETSTLLYVIQTTLFLTKLFYIHIF